MNSDKILQRSLFTLFQDTEITREKHDYYGIVKTSLQLQFRSQSPHPQEETWSWK